MCTLDTETFPSRFFYFFGNHENNEKKWKFGIKSCCKHSHNRFYFSGHFMLYTGETYFTTILTTFLRMFSLQAWVIDGRSWCEQQKRIPNKNHAACCMLIVFFLSYCMQNNIHYPHAWVMSIDFKNDNYNDPKSTSTNLFKGTQMSQIY